MTCDKEQDKCILLPPLPEIDIFPQGLSSCNKNIPPSQVTRSALLTQSGHKWAHIDIQHYLKFQKKAWQYKKLNIPVHDSPFLLDGVDRFLFVRLSLIPGWQFVVRIFQNWYVLIVFSLFRTSWGRILRQ